MHYLVTIVRVGSLSVEAENEIEAMHIADRQPTNSICWDDSWKATNAVEDFSWCRREYSRTGYLNKTRL